MRPSFNTAGPCIPGEHYMLPPERRLGRVMELIDEAKYFTLHAGRQTGKTTSARWLADQYNAGDRYRAIWVDVQCAREEPDPALAFKILLDELDSAVARDLPDLGVPRVAATMLDNRAAAVACHLRDLAARSRFPVIVLLEHADALADPVLRSLLPHIRSGFIARSGTPFPRSLVFLGAHDIRITGEINILADSLTLSPFTHADVEELLAQHTTATQQRFEPVAVACIHDLSQGLPWLVNALADRAVGRDPRRVTVTATHVEAAKEAILREQLTHPDARMAKLQDPRVLRVLDPMIAGRGMCADIADIDYGCGLGLVRVANRRLEIANPIYREVIPRALACLRAAV